MSTYVWPHQLDPGFPLAVLEYRAVGAADPMHWHDHLEIALVQAGQGLFRFGRRTVPAASGDIFLIDDSQPHVAHGQPAEPLQLLLVLFRAELIAGPGCRRLDRGYLAPFRSEGRATMTRVAGGTALGAEVGAVLEELHETWLRRDPTELLLLDATLRRALALVSRGRRVAAETAATRWGDPARELIRPVLAYIDAHRCEPILLEQMAELAHVSASRVRHAFKGVTGIGFKEYVTHVRLGEAKRLLLTTDLAVAGVAQAVGYTNLHQFYKVFYRSCAMSPAEYRRYYTPAVVHPEPLGAVASAGPDHDAVVEH